MKRSHRVVSRAAAAAVVVLLLCAAGCGTGGGSRNTTSFEDVKLDAARIGPGWKLAKEITFDPETAEEGSTLEMLAAIGATRVMNQVFTKGAGRLQVNFVLFPGNEDAKDAVELLEEEEGSLNVYGRVKNVAVEIISDDSAAKKKAAKLLGIALPEEDIDETGGTGFSVEFKLACVDNLDYMKANELSNYLGSYREGQAVDPAMQAVIDSTTFGNKVSLLTTSGTQFEARYSLEPEPKGDSTTDGVTTYTFDAKKLPELAGVPYATVKGKLKVGETDLYNGDGTKLSAEQKSKYLAATGFWPVTDPEITKISAELTGEMPDNAQKVEAVRKWVRDNIDYGGPMGTRYGTLKVLSQKYGRCWDLADVVVTLLRASGVPARELSGWMIDAGSGHVWAEAYFEGEGWVGVDATSDRTGTNTNYLPFFATSDGNMPVLYVEMPSAGD